MNAYIVSVGNLLVYFLLFPLLLCSNSVKAQKVYVNSIDSVYELTGIMGSCNYKAVSGICNLDYRNSIYSSALHKDKFYFISVEKNNLYYAKPGSPQSCIYLTSFPTTGSGPYANSSSLNSLTADKNGLLYAGDYNSGDLYVFDPATGIKEKLGVLPSGTAGDMIFYEDILLAACTDGNIYEVNLSDPASSTVFMNMGTYQFYGLISFPFDCQHNKVYGFSWGGQGTEFVELNMETRSVGQVICSIPELIYDAAGSFETGNTLGISVDSIVIKAPCRNNEISGDVRIVASSASDGDLTYTLDNNQTNKTGVFDDISIGIHYVHITNKEGCLKDTSFKIMHGLSADIVVDQINPTNCALNNGSIEIAAISNYNPVLYSINNENYQPGNIFTDLGAGPYRIQLRDGGNCRIDTTLLLQYQQKTVHPFVSVTPTTCESNSGKIEIQTNVSENIKAASINNGAPKSEMLFDNLDAGRYVVTVFYDSLCRYDTLVTVSKAYDAKPSFSVTKKDQLCSGNNGTITIKTANSTSKLLFSLNNGFFSDQSNYTGLQPGDYQVSIRNENFCRWDTAIQVVPYPSQHMDFSSATIDPDCRYMKSGRINVYVSGNAAPYYLSVNDASYPANTGVSNLDPGKYYVQILNKDKCILDTMSIVLTLQMYAECNQVFVPDTFTPNNDGLNDVFRPLASPYITGLAFKVFNRFGQLVYQKTGVMGGWDGTFKAKPQPGGMYVWTLEYQDFSGTKKKQNGRIMLIR